MKKMKGAASQHPSSVFDDSKIRFKHQTLLQDYHELEKETETAKRKLQMMKQKKMTLIAEVRFLRKRYEYLMKNQLPNDHSNGNPVQQKQLNKQVANNTKKGKNGSRRRPALQPLPTISDINQKERINRRIDIPPQSSTLIPVLDLNQKAKTRKKANQQNSTPVFDLNQKERIYSGRDASERTITPFFDLNQISMEEEELQTNYDTLRADELKKSLLRGGNDEQQNDIKISACRTVGDGPSRAGKRKISWQDQVALRV
ncbi:uncharacterized protein LOC111793773 [Cucurbita pepo subsp. pepo]|uniref:uncharacterized protein LOC111793773 n=1 Tax=Cucurbita pepo subsp. pepo TaxID=3664 RepID=UPI000C9D75F9|nr:uncharacterized protein LOC111793773 [Cucurbita pepo subsp. pepo]